MNRKKTIYEPDEVKLVFDFLKTSKNITDITEVAGISTIETDSLILLRTTSIIYLQNGQIVTIDNINYQVSNVNLSLKTFDITASGLVATTWKLACDFKFGSREEINQILDIESKDPDKRNMRYPFAWLFINESRDHDNLDYDFQTSLKMAFVHLSKAEYKAEYRKENIMKPILVPLVELFTEAIQSNYFARVFNFEYTKLTYRDYFRYFYGSSDKNKMVLNAPTDAIEIDFDITFQNQY